MTFDENAQSYTIFHSVTGSVSWKSHCPPTFRHSPIEDIRRWCFDLRSLSDCRWTVGADCCVLGSKRPFALLCVDHHRRREINRWRLQELHNRVRSHARACAVLGHTQRSIRHELEYRVAMIGISCSQGVSSSNATCVCTRTCIHLMSRCGFIIEGCVAYKL